MTMTWMRRCAAVLALCLVQASVASAQVQETAIYYHADAIGSVRMITDESGQVIARYDYLPFGEPCGVACGPEGPPEVRQFAGKERDAETGFNYFGARYYASGTGRFTTVDPVVDAQKALLDPQQWNRYSYVRNNPLRYVDPDGRAVETPWDVFNIILDVSSLATNVASGNIVGAAVDLGGLVLDAGAAVVPGLLGGAGTAIRAARTAEKAKRIEGVYEFLEPSGRIYVGQSGDVIQRLSQHARNPEKLAPGTTVKITPVSGGKTAREVAEQRTINAHGGTKAKPESRTSNQRNPIGPKRQKNVEELYGDLNFVD